MDKKTYTLEDACEYLKTSDSTLLPMIGAGVIPAAKIGQRWVIRESDLDAYLADQVAAQTEARREAAANGIPSTTVSTGYGSRPGRKRKVIPSLTAA